MNYSVAGCLPEEGRLLKKEETGDDGQGHIRGKHAGGNFNALAGLMFRGCLKTLHNEDW